MALLGAARAARNTLRSSARSRYFTSTDQRAAAAGGSSGPTGALAGGAIVFSVSSVPQFRNLAHTAQLGYGYYHFSGAKSIVNAASTTRKQFNDLAQTVQASAPEPNEALDCSTAESYAAFIPGAENTLISDSETSMLYKLNMAKEQEKSSAVHKELKTVTQSNTSAETASRSGKILEKAIMQLGELTSNSAQNSDVSWTAIHS